MRSNSQNGLREKLNRQRGSRFGAQVVRAKTSIRLKVTPHLVKNLTQPCLSSASPSIESKTRVKEWPYHGIGEGKFTDNFVLVKIPAGFLYTDSESTWVPSPRQELYQLEMKRSLVNGNEELQRMILDVAELELKAIFGSPDSVIGYQRIPRAGRNALTFAVLGDSLLGFEVEKDPGTINKIIKNSLVRVVTRKREVRETSCCAASDITEATEKGSVDLFPICIKNPSGGLGEKLVLNNSVENKNPECNY